MLCMLHMFLCCRQQPGDGATLSREPSVASSMDEAAGLSKRAAFERNLLFDKVRTPHQLLFHWTCTCCAFSASLADGHDIAMYHSAWLDAWQVLALEGALDRKTLQMGQLRLQLAQTPQHKDATPLAAVSPGALMYSQCTECRRTPLSGLCNADSSSSCSGTS